MGLNIIIYEDENQQANINKPLLYKTLDLQVFDSKVGICTLKDVETATTGHETTHQSTVPLLSSLSKWEE